MQKLKTKTQQFTLIAIVSGLLLLGITNAIWITLGAVGNASIKARELAVSYIGGDVGDYVWAINVPRVKAEEKLPMKEWVLKQFADNGINTEVADCVIQRESLWNPDIVSKTYDFGLMAWNIQHVKSGYISLECTGNYKCAVSKAIEKIKKDKGFSAWFGYRDANCGRFGKTFIN
jgi:hypothetical protein